MSRSRVICLLCVIHAAYGTPGAGRRLLSCPNPVMSLVEGECMCPVGSSPQAGDVCACDIAGQYMDPTTKSCKACLSGWYCPLNDVPQRCPANYLSDRGAASVGECYVFSG